MDRETLLDLIPAFALGALDPDERAEFEAWLSRDAEAQRLLAEYRVIAEALVLTAPAREAPAHLQADLRRRLAVVGGPQNVTLPRRQQMHRRRNPAVLRWLAVAAVLVLVLGVILFWSATRVQAPCNPVVVEANTSGELAQLFDQLAGQASARRVAVTPGQGQNQLAGEMVIAPDGGQAVIQVWQLPALSSEKTFELWLIDDGGPRSGGIFRVENPAGPTYISLPLDKSADQYQGFGVSIEPSCGSPEAGTTGPRVFGVSLQSG